MAREHFGSIIKGKDGERETCCIEMNLKRMKGNHKMKTLAIIGCGRIARNAHFPALSKMAIDANAPSITFLLLFINFILPQNRS